MLTIASFWVCLDCRECIVSKLPSDYPVLEKLFVADIEDEGVPTECECDVCSRQDTYGKAYRVEYRLFI